MAGRVFIGTSGWNYPHWRDTFYDGIAQKYWLDFYAQQFNAIEINATFYRLQSSSIFKRWRDETPAGFRFAIKANRYLTHYKLLNDPEKSIQLERARAGTLGGKLAVVLWQLPDRFHKNLDRLQGFVEALAIWPETRHTIEFRHRSWFDQEVSHVLEKSGIAVSQSDAADWPLWDAVTTDMVYVRLHGHTRTYASAYSPASLARWAKVIRKWLRQDRDVHVYFDNDAEAAAPRDAQRLIRLVKK